MGCDMCGKQDKLYNTIVEGTTMQLCSECKSYGEVTSAVGEEHIQLKKKRYTKEYHESNEQIRPSYATTIRQARERARLTQEQLANKLAIKLSQLHKFESNNQAPDIQTAKKLEQALHITLITQIQEEDVTIKKTSTGPLTIADLIKKK